MSSRLILSYRRRSGSRLLLSLSRATPSAVSEHSSELIGCPIPRSLTTSCVRLELRSLPSPGATRLHRYYEPLRIPTAPGLSLRSEEHTSELQSHHELVCRLLLQ